MVASTVPALACQPSAKMAADLGTAMKLSILDQSTHAEGTAQSEAIRNTVSLATLAEELGYSRFWVSEHHNHPTIIGTAPEIMMAAISQRTHSIRLGSAGVMLPHYAPLKVAEQFKVLEALAPGRIDLGLGRAPGGDGMTALALNPNAHEDAENFPANIRDLLSWIGGAPLVDGHPFRAIGAYPHVATAPEPWVLGTSTYGAQVAAHFGIPYCFAHFITDGQGVARALDTYRESYQPSERFPEPKAALCVWALAADTEGEAEELFKTRAYWKIKREQGQMGPLRPPSEVSLDALSPPETRHYESLRQSALAGDGDTVARMLSDLAKAFDIDEVVVLTWTHSQDARRQSYQTLARAAGLVPAQAVANAISA